MAGGATFSRLKVWTTEVVLNTDLNAEFDNILNNLNPAGIDGQQDTLTAMRATLAPSESVLVTALSGEIQNLRYMLLQIAGGNSTYWYTTPTTSLTDLKNAIGGALVNNKIVSGAKSTLSTAPRFLQPNGAADSVKLLATATAFTYVVNGTSYTISADVTLSGMSLAPSSQNTAAVNDATLSAQESTKTLGEDGTTITIGTVGTNITGLTGNLAGFKVVHAATTEYFLAYVASATTLTNCFRGFCVDLNKNPVDRVALSNADTITLLKLTWLYVSTAGALLPVYTNPTFSAIQPTSPNTGDYWYDMVNATWKTFGGVSWASAGATLVGVCMQDATNCVAARAFNFYTGTDPLMNMNLQWLSNTQLQQLTIDGRVSVNGSTAAYNQTRPTWDITANLESGQSRTVSTTYYAYADESGTQYLTTKKPYDMRGSLRGWYHPFENWRAIAKCQLNATGSGNFDPQTLLQYDNNQQVLSQSTSSSYNTISNIGLKASVSGNALTITLTQADGATAPNQTNPVIVPFRGSTITTASFTPRYITSTLSITVPSSATLGQTSAINGYVWVYLIDDAGTIDIGVSGMTVFDDASVQSPTAISGSATSGSTLYSVSGHTSKPIRLIGRCLVNEATAGTWASAPTQIDMLPRPSIVVETWSSARTFTPSAGFGSVGSAVYATRRNGQMLEFNFSFTVGTLTAAAGTFTIPSGLTMDTTNLPAAAKVILGHALSGNTAVTAIGPNGLNAYISYSNTTTIYAGSRTSTGIEQTPCNAYIGAAAVFVVTGAIPILGWATYGPA